MNTWKITIKREYSNPQVFTVDAKDLKSAESSISKHVRGEFFFLGAKQLTFKESK